MPALSVPSVGGRPITARFVKIGDRYGLNDCLVHGAEKTDLREPMIEFYCPENKAHGPRGYFISRYYVSTLIERVGKKGHVGLCLDGGQREFDLSAEAMAEVHGMIAQFLDEQT